MSVLIRGMKMPQNGFITITIGSGGTVVGNAQKIDNKFEDLDNKEIASAVSIPPHGRLIDADALIIDLMDRGVEDVQTDDWHEIQQAIEDAPTIIEAEEGASDV